MNLIDKAIGYFDPLAGIRRANARAALKQLSAYEAAAPGRGHGGWRRSGLGPKNETEYATPNLAKAARDLHRNNPTCFSAVEKLTYKVVGKGIMPKGGAKRAARAFAEWAARPVDVERRLTWPQVQALAMRTVIVSGEAFIRWYRIGGNWRCQVLEGEYLDVNKQRPTDGDNYIIQGVEYSPTGERVAYWMFAEHPDDYSAWGARLGVRTSARVPAEQVDHVFRPMRPGQVRGTSWLAPAILTARDAADLDMATLLRRKVEASLAMVITRQADGAPLGALSDGVGENEGSKIETIKPGMVHYARPGEEPKFLEPPTSGDFAELRKHYDRLIAAGIGVPYHTATGDLRDANYSSMRNGRIDFEPVIDGHQDMLIAQMCAPAWGRVTLSDPPTTWVRPIRPFLDPAKEIPALIAEVRAGFKSMHDVHISRGSTPEEFLTEVAQWQELREQLAPGVKFETDVQSAPAMEPQAEEPEDEELEDEPEEEAPAEEDGAPEGRLVFNRLKRSKAMP